MAGMYCRFTSVFGLSKARRKLLPSRNPATPDVAVMACGMQLLDLAI